jgi:hypothetical protein
MISVSAKVTDDSDTTHRLTAVAMTVFFIRALPYCVTTGGEA